MDRSVGMAWSQKIPRCSNQGFQGEQECAVCWSLQECGRAYIYEGIFLVSIEANAVLGIWCGAHVSNIFSMANWQGSVQSTGEFSGYVQQLALAGALILSVDMHFPLCSLNLHR
jgi:hypothetical protein